MMSGEALLKSEGEEDADDLEPTDHGPMMGKRAP